MGKRLDRKIGNKAEDLNIFDFLDTITTIILKANENLLTQLKQQNAELYLEQSKNYLELKKIVEKHTFEIQKLQGVDSFDRLIYRNKYTIISVLGLIIFGLSFKLIFKV